jgi:transposase
LGVDDWAFHKGHRYGTILVDLERRQPGDLLPDRESATLAVWLTTHPGMQIITRDRSANAPFSWAYTHLTPTALLGFDP